MLNVVIEPRYNLELGAYPANSIIGQCVLKY